MDDGSGKDAGHESRILPREGRDAGKVLSRGDGSGLPLPVSPDAVRGRGPACHISVLVIFSNSALSFLR